MRKFPHEGEGGGARVGPDRKTLGIGMLLVTIVGSCPEKCLDMSQAVFSNSLDTNRFR